MGRERPADCLCVHHDVRFADAYKMFLNKYSLDEIGIDENVIKAARKKTKGREVSF